ncbi:hypothetical protein BJ741DRAFT_634443 [Chytriomyces cf. hyalinus JEL632]|nr:hypothetical protein BJ741DRAFT_634443 [Chytriomyces cf. hyalinus JEL632]
MSDKEASQPKPGPAGAPGGNGRGVKGKPLPCILKGKGKAKAKQDCQSSNGTTSKTNIDENQGVMGMDAAVNSAVMADVSNAPPSQPNSASDKPRNSANVVSNSSDPSKNLPEACLFVASLSSSLSDAELLAGVEEHFLQWGSLTNVKVLKDWLARPYAFVQFENQRDAQVALARAHNTLIHGRYIRVEQAKVNRTLFIAKVKGIPVEELKSRLEAFGPVEDINLLHNHHTNRSKGCGFVKFRLRDDAIKAFLGVRQQYPWVVEWATNFDQSKPELDLCTIFVGQLNQKFVTPEMLRERFEKYGEIHSLQLVNKLHEEGPSSRPAFAFITYVEESGAESAIEFENAQMWMERTIRVQYREIGEQKGIARAANRKSSDRMQQQPGFHQNQAPPLRDSRAQVSAGPYQPNQSQFGYMPPPYSYGGPTPPNPMHSNPSPAAMSYTSSSQQTQSESFSFPYSFMQDGVMHGNNQQYFHPAIYQQYQQQYYHPQNQQQFIPPQVYNANYNQSAYAHTVKSQSTICTTSLVSNSAVQPIDSAGKLIAPPEIVQRVPPAQFVPQSTPSSNPPSRQMSLTSYRPETPPSEETTRRSSLENVDWSAVQKPFSYGSRRFWARKRSSHESSTEFVGDWGFVPRDPGGIRNYKNGEYDAGEEMEVRSAVL